MDNLQSIGGISPALPNLGTGAASMPAGADMSALMQQVGSSAGQPSAGQQGDGSQISDEAREEEHVDPKELMKQQLETSLKEIDNKIRSQQKRLAQASENAEEGGDGRAKTLQREMDHLQKERGELQTQLTQLLGGNEGGGKDGGGGDGGGGVLGGLVDKAAGGVGHIISGLFD